MTKAQSATVERYRHPLHRHQPNRGKARFKQVKGDSKLNIASRIEARLYYHGTSRRGAKSIREKGLLLSKKKAGATYMLTKQRNEKASVDPAAKNFHYLTADLKTATDYAKCHKKPQVVGVILPLELIPEADPHEPNGVRVSGRISPEFILKSHPSSHDARILKREMNSPTKEIKNAIKNTYKSMKSDAKRLLNNDSPSKLDELKEEDKKITELALSRFAGSVKEGATFNLYELGLMAED